MPDSEVEDSIHNSYELNTSSQYQFKSQAVDDNWPVLRCSHWAGKQSHIGESLSFNAKSHYPHQLDSGFGHGGQLLNLSLDENYTQLNPGPEFCNTSIGQQLNTNDFIYGGQCFQARQNQSGILGEPIDYDQHCLMLKGLSVIKSHQEYVSGDSPTITTTSERSEITEASTDFNFCGGSRHFLRGKQQKGPSQPQIMQQPGYNDMQFLKQQMMFKQLQELQRHQQLQQSSLNQLSTLNKRDVGPEFSPLINGTPVNDSSQMFMNWVQRGGPSPAQGVSNKLMFSQEHGQASHSMNPISRQLDISPYGTSISGGGVSMDQYSGHQGMYNDSANLLINASGHAEKPLMQSTAFCNAFVLDHTFVSTDQISLSQGTSKSKQDFQERNVFERVPVHGLDSSITSGNMQQVNTLQTNALLPEFPGRQDGAGWSRILQQNMTQLVPSQGLVLLDPVEEKILFNMDDNMCDASFGGTLDHSDYPNSVPGIQSGSWSALMQSAVAEASSSDTGIHEEWSGLTFQNNELSPENQTSNIAVESNKQQSDWVENNLQSPSSLSSSPFSMFNDSSMNSSFPGFQQVEPLEHLDNTWAGQIYEQSECDAYANQKRTTSYNNFSKPQGDPNEATFYTRDSDGFLWKTDNQLDCVKRGISLNNDDNKTMRKDHYQATNGPIVMQNSYDSGCEAFFEKQHQRDNAYNHFSSKKLNTQEQGHSAQSGFIGDISQAAMNLEKGRLTDFQVNLEASEDAPSRGIMDASYNFQKPISYNGPNFTGQPRSDRLFDGSQNILELLHKVDHSKGNSIIQHFSSTPLSELTETGLPKTPVSQQYNQASLSQGFNLRLASQSKGLIHSNPIIPSQCFPQSTIDLNLWGANSGLGVENQLTHPSSVHSLPDSQELPRKDNLDDKLNIRQIGGNITGPHFPVLEALPVSGPPTPSVKGPHGGLSVREKNVWKSRSMQQHLLVDVANKVPPIDQLNNSMEITSSAHRGLNDQNLSSQLGMAYKNSQECDPGIVEPERYQKSIPHNIHGVLDMGELSRNISNANAVSSGSLLSYSHNRDFIMQPVGNIVPTGSERNDSFDHVLKPQLIISQDLSLPDQVKTLKNVETDLRRVFDIRQRLNSEGIDQDSALQLNSSSFGNRKMLISFSTGKNEDLGVQVSLQPPQDTLLGGMISAGQNESQSQYSSNAVLPSWLGTFSNGQMASMYNGQLLKDSGGTYSFPRLSQVPSESFSTPYIASDVTGQSMGIVRPKKRKSAAYEFIPWHKEVTQGSRRAVNFGSAEQDWAEATDHLMDKMEDRVEMIGKPVLQSKRRLILSRQLTQQLLSPAPKSILSADATSQCNAAYFIARLSLGDACSLISSSRNDLHVSMNNNNAHSENLKDVESTADNKFFTNVVEGFSNRADKVENDLLRLERGATSILDLRVECQDLERISVINRFAKFHIRQTDTSRICSSGLTTTAPKTCPQRYVTAYPMPRNLPEGVHCLSL